MSNKVIKIKIIFILVICSVFKKFKYLFGMIINYINSKVIILFIEKICCFVIISILYKVIVVSKIFNSLNGIFL